MSLERDTSIKNIEQILTRKNMIHKVDYWLKTIRVRGWRRNVSQLLGLIEPDEYDISIWAKPYMDKQVHSVCTVNDFFEKNSICVQMYYVTDDDIRWAIKNGAIVAITNKQIDNLPCVVAKNPLYIYARICEYYRILHDISATIVIGSIGKTTTKRMIEAVYKQQYKSFADPTNRNLLCNAGYDAQHIPFGTKKMIEEVAEGVAGYSQYSSMIFHPNVVVITSIDKSHFERFGSQMAIAKEICSATDFMAEDGLVVVNKDEFSYYELLRNRNVCTVSITDTSADIYACNITVTEQGLRFDIVDGKNTFHALLNNIFAKHNVLIALYAYAAGKKEEVTPENIIKGLSSFANLGFRQNIFRTSNNVVVYADCFNAIAKSVEAAIVSASNIPIRNKSSQKEGRRIAVLGDIEEVGGLSSQMHESIIQCVEQSNFDYLLTVGTKMNAAINNVKTRESLKIVPCKNHEQTIAEINKIKPTDGDLILFKASHSGRFDKIMISAFPDTKKLIEIENAVGKKWKLRSMLS